MTYRPATRLQAILLCIAGALLLMVVAFYNGYPLYMGDTHAYMTIGFTDIIPFDRSPFYGYFIRHSSLHETLWLTILAQNMILSFLLVRYYTLLSVEETVAGAVLFFICTVSFTYVSWVMSCLQSDAFTPIVLLALLLYLCDTQASRGMQRMYVLLAFVGITMHNSHFLIVCIIGVVLLAYALVKRIATLVRKAAVMMGTGLLYFLLMCCMNAAHGYGFTFSRASNLFLMAKFAETGILDTYLNEACDRKDLRLCQYKNEITPYPWSFMFDEQSPYARMGGYEGSKKEFGIIIRDVMTTPKCLIRYMIRSASFTMRQMAGMQETNNVLTLPQDSWQRSFVKYYLPAEEKEFLRGKQDGGRLDNSAVNVVNMLFFIFSTIAVLLLRRQIAGGKVANIYFFFLLFFVVNAFVTATVSTVDNRYSFRIFWLLPATNIALLLNYVRGLMSREGGRMNSYMRARAGL